MGTRTLFQTTTLSIAVMVVLAAPARAQSSGVPVDRPKFDAASIKPNKSGEQGTYLRRQPGGLYKAANVPLRALIASAYLNEFPPKGRLIFGGPSWIDSEHFDLEARAEGNPGNEQERLMAQSLVRIDSSWCCTTRPGSFLYTRSSYRRPEKQGLSLSCILVTQSAPTLRLIGRSSQVLARRCQRIVGASL
jgi:Protein of unknown function (DUF3738)